jgi:hypothetical protein|tara:strand:- start:59 stop:241 length:183 start_codon:yes stop_codon:yes gene_type:complete
MTYTYKKIPDYDDSGNKIGDCTDQILRKEDNAIIPSDEDNKDYQEYLLWVSEGNTAEASD